MGGQSTAQRLQPEGRKDCPQFDPARLTIVEDAPGAKYRDHRGTKIKETFVINVFWNGVMQSVEIKSTKRKDGSDILEVVAGRKRVRAARICNEWIDSPDKAPNEAIRAACIERQAIGAKILVPCLLSPEKDPVRRYERMVGENTHRHESSPLAKARQLADYLTIGGSLERAPQVFGVTTTTISNWQALLECSPNVQQAVETGVLPAVAATELAKLNDHEEQDKAFQDMVASGVTKGYAAREAAENAAAGKPAKPSQERARMRPRRFLERSRDELHELRADHDCALAANLIRYMLGEDAALRRMPESVRDAFKNVAPRKR